MASPREALCGLAAAKHLECVRQPVGAIRRTTPTGNGQHLVAAVSGGGGRPGVGDRFRGEQWPQPSEVDVRQDAGDDRYDARQDEGGEEAAHHGAD